MVFIDHLQSGFRFERLADGGGIKGSGHKKIPVLLRWLLLQTLSPLAAAALLVVVKLDLRRLFATRRVTPRDRVGIHFKPYKFAWNHLDGPYVLGDGGR